MRSWNWNNQTFPNLQPSFGGWRRCWGHIRRLKSDEWVLMWYWQLFHSRRQVLSFQGCCWVWLWLEVISNSIGTFARGLDDYILILWIGLLYYVGNLKHPTCTTPMITTTRSTRTRKKGTSRSPQYRVFLGSSGPITFSFAACTSYAGPVEAGVWCSKTSKPAVWSG